MEIHRLSAQIKDGNPYVEFLRTTHLSAGVYKLPVGAVDTQSPHAEEEVYFVVSGRAQFSRGTSDVAVKTGDLLFVPANEPHRFYDITEDLELLVFFAPAEGTTAGLPR